MNAAITVLPKPHWINGWFLRLFAQPYVLVDDVEHAAQWGRGLKIETSPGRHTVVVGARYHRTKALLGVAATEVEAQANQHVGLIAQNGPLNHQAFALRATKHT